MISYNTLVVACGVATVGFAAGVVGCFGVLRRRALVGDAAAHATLVGVALAFLATGRRDLAVLLAGGFVSAMAALGVLSELRDAGRLVLVVHHDLRTAAQWFNRVALIDRRLVAAGPTATVLTSENLERTYVGRLDLLDELGRAVEERGRTS
jgi:hypothetical protein